MSLKKYVAPNATSLARLLPLFFGLGLMGIACDKSDNPVPQVSPSGTTPVPQPQPEAGPNPEAGPKPGTRPGVLVQATLPLLQISTRPLAIDKNGTPFVVSTQSDSFAVVPKAVVKYWDGAAWSQLGDALNVTTDRAAVDAVIAVDGDGKPFVAWEEGAGIYVKKWNGTAWIPIGGSLSLGTMRSEQPSIALDSTGKPFVAWVESLYNDTFGAFSDFIVKRWTGTEWVEVGDGVRQKNQGRELSLAINSSDQAVVAWIGAEVASTVPKVFVKQSTAGAWSTRSTSPSNPMIEGGANLLSIRPSLTLGADQTPVVAWYESINVTVNVFVSKASSGLQTWTPLGAGFSEQNPVKAYVPSIALDASGNFVVAYCEKIGDTQNTYVKRWNGAAWLPLGGGALDTDIELATYAPAVVVNKQANVASIVWRENPISGNSATIVYKEVSLK
jgi:hypothetical protein